MTKNEIIKEIEKDINDVVDKTTFYKNDNIDFHIKSILITILEKYHYSKIREYIVISEYPKVQVLIKHKDLEIAEIKVLKFERLNKLHRLNLISKY
jgi:hypothetical protein